MIIELLDRPLEKDTFYDLSHVQMKYWPTLTFFGIIKHLNG